MSEMEEISARLVALETVVAQLITHLAVRADDPAGWVATRKTLALHALDDGAGAPTDQQRRIRAAIAEFFDQAETVADDYRLPEQETPEPFVR